MLEVLFGADMPLAVRFFLAFLIVLGLIGATAWAVRRFGAGRLGGAGLGPALPDRPVPLGALRALRGAGPAAQTAG